MPRSTLGAATFVVVFGVTLLTGVWLTTLNDCDGDCPPPVLIIVGIATCLGFAAAILVERRYR